VTCAKGLTSGYLPLGVVMFSDSIAKYFETNMLWGGLTYKRPSRVLRAAVRNLQIYEEEKSLPMSNDKGAISRHG